jgi:hypothetical protein
LSHIFIKSHILKGLFNIILKAQNTFEMLFCAANAIASHQTQAQAINAVISYQRFEIIIIIQIIQIHTITTFFHIEKICLSRSQTFSFNSKFSNIDFIKEFIKKSSAIMNETTKALSI